MSGTLVAALPVDPAEPPAPVDWTSHTRRRRTRRRYAAERGFRWLTAAALAIGLGFLAYLVAAVAARSVGGYGLSLLVGADATEPTRAGIGGALIGSLFTVGLALALAVPVGIAAALYLEELAPRTRWSRLIDVSVANLAAVPSLIFGLFGLAVFLGIAGLPRSAPLVGGLTLALMTLPVVVIAARGAVRAVPASVREAALGVGASRTQVALHHVLPLALPGMLTGAILGAARALGETAALLVIGMRAFIPAPPTGLHAPATVLPVQIFLWSDQPGFEARTAAAITVMLALLLVVNGAAIRLRARFEAPR